MGNDTLFYHRPRSYKGPSDRNESNFNFLNRSGWSCAETARNTLETWFNNIPKNKKHDLKERFRSDDDRQHAGALLEIATHRILQTVAHDVQGDPVLGEGRPDFSAIYKGKKIFLECTVAQSIDGEVAATNRENHIKAAIDSIDTGSFKLTFEVFESSTDTPSTRQLRKQLERWVSSLDPHQESKRLRRGHEPPSKCWSNRGWKLKFTAVPYEVRDEARAIVIDVGQAQEVHETEGLRKAIKVKAKKYISLDEHPYVLVVGSGMKYSGDRHFWQMIDRDRLVLKAEGNLIHLHKKSIRLPETNGIYGSWLLPRNREVSAILFKSRFRDVWSIGSTSRPWVLIHHPEANNPLPYGMFPFAVEYVACTKNDARKGISSFPMEYKINFGTFRRLDPVCTINDLLDLPTPWPGEGQEYEPRECHGS